SVSAASVTEPLVRSATRVFFQKRRRAIEAGTVIAVVPELTVQTGPWTSFSGRPPSAGGLNRGSRHVPVQTGWPLASSSGSCAAGLDGVSVVLELTSVRYGVLVPSMLGS